MNVLVIGSGAREHTIGWSLAKNSEVKLFFAPGNAGTASIGSNLDLPLPTPNAGEEIWNAYFLRVTNTCFEKVIDLAVIQTERALAFGMGDFLEAKGIKTFAVRQETAEIEASKIWGAGLFHEYSIPSPSSLPLFHYSDEIVLPDDFLVVKKSGLAEGKGVKVTDSSQEALKVTKDFLKEGQAVLLQERLSGKEVSAHAFSDGLFISPMPLSCDYKRIGEGNTGENTGGVGAYSAPEIGEEIEREINRFTFLLVSAMGQEKRTYRSVIFPGLMITESGPKVIEVNCRFGDPETQVLLPRLGSDLLTIMLACINGTLADQEIKWSGEKTVCVVLCSKGYPGLPEIGKVISGLDKVADDILVFHAGTGFNDLGEIVTTSGRVLSIVGKGKTLQEAREKVYRAIEFIKFDGELPYFRRDIAEDQD